MVSYDQLEYFKHQQINTNNYLFVGNLVIVFEFLVLKRVKMTLIPPKSFTYVHLRHVFLAQFPENDQIGHDD